MHRRWQTMTKMTTTMTMMMKMTMMKRAVCPRTSPTFCARISAAESARRESECARAKNQNRHTNTDIPSEKFSNCSEKEWECARMGSSDIASDTDQRKGETQSI
jgi:hypothetical protein